MSTLFADQAVEVIGPDVGVDGLVYDSRRVRPGVLFAALSGAAADGHRFIDDAIGKGAAAVLCGRTPEASSVGAGSPTYVIAPAPRRALALAARRFHGAPDERLTMVGVTGTNGKTTTARIVHGILDAVGRRSGVIGTLGVEHRDRDGALHQPAATGLTTPDSVDLADLLAQMVAAGTDAVAMEVSSHALDQERVAGVSYDVGVFTNLTHDHLDYHGSLEAYFETKARLFRERLKSGGVAVLNLDDPRVAALAGELEGPVLGFARGAGSGASLWVESVSLSREGLALRVGLAEGWARRAGAEALHLTSPLLGDFNIENILAAVGAALALGLSGGDIASALPQVGAVPGRLERVGGPRDPLVLVDYAHTPDALAKALATVRPLTSGDLWCVFGCGGDRDAQKRPVMGRVAADLADRIIVTNDNPRSEDPRVIAEAIRAGIEEGAANREDPPWVSTELDRDAAIGMAVSKAGSEDTILVAGKGHEDYQILGERTVRFDDREAVGHWLERRSMSEEKFH